VPARKIYPLIKRKPVSPKFIDLSGQTFGLLTVKELYGFQGNNIRWKCECSCGRVSFPFGNQLRAGKVVTCGCSTRTLDGLSGHPLHGIWIGMIQRCENENNPSYPKYGGRGIRVCERWRNSFLDFVSDVGERPTLKHSLDRYPNNNGNYEPGNVRWATASQQMSNTRRTRHITHNGETLTMTQWAKRFGITTEGMRVRLKRSPETAMEASRRRNRSPHPVSEVA
jgi:hypothetical protein